MTRRHCDALIETLQALVGPFGSILEGISQEVLNRQPAEHKMSLGQMALHTFGYMRLYMTGAGPAPFEKAPRTAVPAEYPLTSAFVDEQIELGRRRMAAVLGEADDATLEGPWPMPGGKVVKLGYICSRLLHHIMVHGAQMAYVRQMYEPGWKGRGWGEMVTPLIALPYHTTTEVAK